MSLRMDPLLARALARELDSRLRRARVRALLLEPDGRRVTLFLREHTLVFEMHPQAGWISLLEPREPLEPARPLASRIHSVRSLPDESALVIGLQRVRGRDEGVELVLEYTANRWNAVVVGHESRQIRHVLLPRPGGDRPLAPGHPWSAPPDTDRAGAGDGRPEGAGKTGQDPVADTPPDSVWEDVWAQATGAGGSEAAQAGSQAAQADVEALRRPLLSSVAWLSSLNVPRLLVPPPTDPTELRRRWTKLTDPASWGAHLVETPRGLQPYPVRLPGHPSEPTASLMEAFAAARRASDAGPEHALLVPARLLERGRARLKRLEGRLRGLERQLAGARDPAPIRARGDLLLARFHEVPRGSDHVTLMDFEGQEVTLELDPSLSPQENAASFYDEAARLDRARTRLPDQIEATRYKVEQWTRLVEGVESGSEESDVLARALGPEDEGSRGRRGGRGKSATRAPYRRYRSSNGLEIRVGRGARSNDDLTFRHSSPDDVWMHVRQAPGAHVILRWDRDDPPPPRDLAEAAILAALHSDARGSGTVPVDWTRRKHVRKPRKAPPGAVLPDRVQTVFVEPDPTLKTRLAIED